MAERDGLGSGWDRLEHQERSREPLQDSQYEGERTEKVFPSFGGQRPLARKYGGSLADGTTKSRAFQQGRPMAALQRARRKEGKAVAWTRLEP